MRIQRDILAASIILLLALLGVGCSDETTAPPKSSPEASCVDFGQFLHVEGTIPVNDMAYRVAESGNWLFAAAGTEGVYAVDLSNPALPALATILPTGGDARDIVVVDTIAVVANGSAGLITLGLSMPWNPTILDELSLAGDVTGVEVRGDYAYVADGGLGLRVVDIRDPSNLSVLASENTPGEPVDIELSATHAFLSDMDLGVRIVSIVDPMLPDFVTSIPVGNGEAYGVALVEPWLCVAAGATGVVVYDVGNPAHPRVAAFASLPGGTRDVAASGNRLYAADRFLGLWALSLDNPPALSVVARLETQTPALRVSAGSDRVWVGDSSNGFTFVDVSNPAPPPLRSDLVLPGRGYGVFDRGPAVYVCAGDEGILIVDVSANGQATRVGQVSFGTTSAEHMVVDEGFGYVATPAGLDIIDLSNPLAPVITPGPRIPVERSAVQDSLLLVAGGIGGLAVYKITAPGSLGFQGGAATQGLARDVVAMPGRAFVAASNSGLIEIDTTDPLQPDVTAALPVGGAALGIAAMGDYVVIAAGTSGLRVIDVSTPRFPVLAGSLELPGNSAFVFVDGTTAYVASRLGGVHVIDLSIAAGPRIVGTLTTPDQAEGVLVRAGHMLAIDRSCTLSVTLARCK